MVALNHGRGQELTFTIGADRDGKVRRVPARDRGRRGRLPGPRRVPAEPDRPDVERRLRDPDDRDLEPRRTSRTRRRSPRSAARAGRRRRRRSSARWTSLAAELQLDPAEIRRRNFIPKDAFPYTTASARGLRLRRLRGRARPRAALGRLRRAARGAAAPPRGGRPEAARDRDQHLRRDHERDRRDGVRRGRDHGRRRRDPPHRLVLARPGPRDDLRDDRRRAARAAAREDHGRQGRHRRGREPAPAPTARSRCRSAARRRKVASEEVVEHAKKLTADYLEAAASDIVLDPALGRLPSRRLAHPGAHVGGARRRGPQPTGSSRSSRSCTSSRAPPTFPFGAHVAVVEVDVETAQVELLRLVAVDDAGTLINPLVAEGQVHGGVATGVSQALYEHFTYDADGNAADEHVPRLRLPVGGRPPLVGGGRDGDADAARTRSARRGSASRARSARRPPSRAP